MKWKIIQQAVYIDFRQGKTAWLTLCYEVDEKRVNRNVYDKTALKCANKHLNTWFKRFNYAWSQT